MEREEFTLAHDVVQKQNPESKNDRKHENERERESGEWEGGADASGRLILAPLEDVCMEASAGLQDFVGQRPRAGASRRSDREGFTGKLSPWSAHSRL